MKHSKEIVTFVCTTCGYTFTLDYKVSGRRICPSCYKKQKKEQMRRWRSKNNPAKLFDRKCYQASIKYGVSRDKVKEMILSAKGYCAVCTNPFTSMGDMMIDHCHQTGAVRGVLCRACNIMLGYVEKSPNWGESFSNNYNSYLAFNTAYDK